MASSSDARASEWQVEEVTSGRALVEHPAAAETMLADGHAALAQAVRPSEPASSLREWAHPAP